MHFNVQNCEDFLHRGIILFPWQYVKHVIHCIKIAPSVYSFSRLDFFTEPFISLFVSSLALLPLLLLPLQSILDLHGFLFFFVLHIIFLFFPSHVVVVVLIFTFSLLFSGDLPQTLSIDHCNFRLSLYFFIQY
jgi:hypothetical protein